MRMPFGKVSRDAGVPVAVTEHDDAPTNGRRGIVRTTVSGTPCLVCGHEPTRQEIAVRAELARGLIELVLDGLDWANEPALSRAIDRLVQLEEGED